MKRKKFKQGEGKIDSKKKKNKEKERGFYFGY